MSADGKVAQFIISTEREKQEGFEIEKNQMISLIFIFIITV